MKTIVSSRTYQLSHKPNSTNRDDVTNYSRSMARGLDAEVLLDAVAEVTGVAETFSTAITEGATVGQAPAGTRAIQLRDPVKPGFEVTDLSLPKSVSQAAEARKKRIATTRRPRAARPRSEAAGLREARGCTCRPTRRGGRLSQSSGGRPRDHLRQIFPFCYISFGLPESHHSATER